MKYRLGLSAENIHERVSPLFEGVGLLRGEYLCRKINKYVTIPECSDYISRYIKRIATLFSPDPVWYRLIEMEVEEINILDGVDRIIEEKNTILGFRGVRRSKLYKDTFLLELKAITEVALEHPNVHVLIPYIYDPSELVFVKDCLNEVGFRNQVGIMAEIPSTILCLEDFLKLGIDNVTVGMNDLSSLVLGAYRGSGLDNFLHPAVKTLLIHAREVTRQHSVPLSVAGYIDRELIKFVEDLDYDYAVLHYSKLGELLGAEFSSLPHQEDLQQIKLKTRELMRKRHERIAVEKWKKQQLERIDTNIHKPQA